MVTYRKANLTDLKEICRFCDFWLSGRGKSVGAIGAVDDCFISPGQHKRYIKRYTTLLAIEDENIVGWAVRDLSYCLIHLLVSGEKRNQGIGKMTVYILAPEKVRCKFNQSTGDPGEFYLKVGYHKTATVKSRSRVDIDKIKPERKPCIDIYEK